MWQTFLSHIDTMVNVLVRVFSIIGASLMAVLTLVVFTEVISRYFFGLPITFTGELTTVIFPWMVFLMAIEVTKNRDHISITYFRSLFPIKVQWLLRLLSLVAVLTFSVFMVISSFRLSVASSNINLPVLRFLTKVHQYSSLTVSFFLVSLVTAADLIRFIAVPDEPAKDDGLFVEISHHSSVAEETP